MAKIMRATPYAQINGTKFYKIKDVAEYVGRSSQTLALWDKWSDEREANGESRLIPPCVRIGSNRVKCWSEHHLELVLAFSRSVSYGDLSKYTRKRRGKEVSEDRSTETRNAVKKYRNDVNKNAKKISKKAQREKEKLQRKQLIENIRKSAKNITNL